ncbi:hypothetical protein SCLCIDRAFT_21576 [Scleroderma citrinum Foug A]|uniref:MULE transposase domain-containing protein n=1 Tax=Scleroderma citrinum Foug A TaxID=1036808 RepID=A0A0C3E1X8_9AGAM|nr:hypothetical protein SCLCIDRAFT_21576 [Scleroderma citrinum Foug A]
MSTVPNLFATHADYNSNLLEDLLLKWKHEMGKNPADSGDFNIRVVLMDNDTREHKALSKHGTTPSIGSFKLFPVLLKNIYHFEDPIELYNKQLFHFQELAKKSVPISQKKSQGSLAFLSYFHTYIKMKDFWHAWSPAGFFEASKLLGVTEVFLPHTTNHLESFNHHIKSCYFASYQHSR